MQELRDGPLMLMAILLMAAIGEPVRRWRVGHQKRADAERAVEAGAR